MRRRPFEGLGRPRKNRRRRKTKRKKYMNIWEKESREDEVKKQGTGWQ